MTGAIVVSGKDYGATVRDAAVASLLAYNTLAGSKVQAERIDRIDPADLPLISVFSDTEAQTSTKAGTAPSFNVTLHLVVQVLVYRARQADAVADIDTLIFQVMDCLFGDPAWVAMTDRIDTYATTRSFKAENDQVIGDGRIKIDCVWTNETWSPRITAPLHDIKVNDPAVFPTAPPEIEFDIPVS